jgi:type IV pilus assembly protein PilO
MVDINITGSKKATALDLNNIDWKNLGTAPLLLRLIIVFILFVLVLGGGGYYFFVDNPYNEPAMIAQFENKLIEKEKKIKEFKEKQQEAANLNEYLAQKVQLERRLQELYQQLPKATEMENLLVKVSDSARDSQLKEQKFEPQDDRSRDFYFEKPIQLVMTGSYMEIGNFISALAGLDRIVTIHNIQLTPNNQNPQPSGNRNAVNLNDIELTLAAEARTYYVKEGEK